MSRRTVSSLGPKLAQRFPEAETEEAAAFEHQAPERQRERGRDRGRGMKR